MDYPLTLDGYAMRSEAGTSESALGGTKRQVELPTKISLLDRTGVRNRRLAAVELTAILRADRHRRLEERKRIARRRQECFEGEQGDEHGRSRQAAASGA